ncbi:hypothetical protein ACFX2I_030521 [Malus domestica]
MDAENLKAFVLGRKGSKISRRLNQGRGRLEKVGGDSTDAKDLIKAGFQVAEDKVNPRQAVFQAEFQEAGSEAAPRQALHLPQGKERQSHRQIQAGL